MVRLLPGGAPHDGEFIRNLRLIGKQLAELHAWNFASDRVKLAPELARRIGLHVIGLHVTGPAAQANHDDRFAASLSRYRTRCFEAEEVGKSEAAERKPASFEKAAARNAIAELLGTTVKECQ